MVLSIFCRNNEEIIKEFNWYYLPFTFEAVAKNVKGFLMEYQLLFHIADK